MTAPRPDVLVKEHLAWAVKLARGKAKRLYGMDEDDAIGEAMIGLVMASRTWKSDGAPFRIWAQRRIVGSILDFHRRADPVGRHQRLADKHGVRTKASDRGVPARVDEDVLDLERRGKIAPANDAPQAASVELLETLGKVRAMPARVAFAMERHFFVGENLAIVGDRLGVSESRACQLVKDGRGLLAGKPLRNEVRRGQYVPTVNAPSAPTKRRRTGAESQFPCPRCGQMGHDGRSHSWDRRRAREEKAA